MARNLIREKFLAVDFFATTFPLPIRHKSFFDQICIERVGDIGVEELNKKEESKKKSRNFKKLTLHPGHCSQFWHLYSLAFNAFLLYLLITRNNVLSIAKIYVHVNQLTTKARAEAHSGGSSFFLFFLRMRQLFHIYLAFLYIRK
jgi:hypothetical protein